MHWYSRLFHLSIVSVVLLTLIPQLLFDKDGKTKASLNLKNFKPKSAFCKRFTGKTTALEFLQEWAEVTVYDTEKNAHV